MARAAALPETSSMNTRQSFTVLTRDDRFQVLVFDRAGERAPFAEFCGTSHGCERMTRVGLPQNLVFSSEEQAADYLLHACVADIAVLAGPVCSVRHDSASTLALAA